MRNDPVAVILRVLCKLYALALKGATKTIRWWAEDPTLILTQYQTKAQLDAQAHLDQVTNQVPSSGELLVIIPFRDRWNLTHACLKSLQDQELPAEVVMKIILVDNDSSAQETKEGLARAAKEFSNLNVRFYSAPYAFNFSKLNNDGFRFGKTEFTKWVLFLNNDVVLVDKHILSQMVVASASNPQLGAIGCTLLYPDQTVQHLFAAPGVKLVAAHPLKRLPYNVNEDWYKKPLRVVAAVTGAVMLVRAQDFVKVGMFDEQLPTQGQDIDLCLALTKCELFPAVVTKTVVLHHESKTRKSHFSYPEMDYIYKKWGRKLTQSPLYSQKFSRWSEEPVFTLGNEPDFPWQHLI